MVSVLLDVFRLIAFTNKISVIQNECDKNAYHASSFFVFRNDDCVTVHVQNLLRPIWEQRATPYSLARRRPKEMVHLDNILPRSLALPPPFVDCLFCFSVINLFSASSLPPLVV